MERSEIPGLGLSTQRNGANEAEGAAAEPPGPERNGAKRSGAEVRAAPPPLPPLRLRSRAESTTPAREFRGAERTELCPSRSPGLTARRAKQTVGGRNDGWRTKCSVTRRSGDKTPGIRVTSFLVGIANLNHFFDHVSERENAVFKGFYPDPNLTVRPN